MNLIVKSLLATFGSIIGAALFIYFLIILPAPISITIVIILAGISIFGFFYDRLGKNN